MPLKQLKRMVKASPFLYERLFPMVMSARRARKRARDKKRDKAIARFRDFCLKLTTAVAQPVFVKVGANDGIGDDPCSDIFLANANWSGLLIEPVPFWFERLKANFKGESRFRFEPIAVGSPAGQSTFYYVDPKGRERMPNWEDWFDKLGSFDRNHILKHAGGILAPFIIETQVPVYPLTEVLARNQIREVHLLHVDAEGYDYEVLKTLDFSQVTPLAIFIEHFHLPITQKKEMVEFLIRRGYDVHDCISDYFAVNREAAQRRLKNASF